MLSYGLDGCHLVRFVSEHLVYLVQELMRDEDGRAPMSHPTELMERTLQRAFRDSRAAEEALDDSVDDEAA